MKLSTTLTTLLVAMVSIAISNPGAKANDLTDDLNNWGVTAGHADALTLDSGNNVNFRGDTSRVKCNVAGSGSFFYHAPNVKTFTGAAFYFQQDPGTIEVYTSQDTSQWTPVPISYSQPVMTFDGWYTVQFAPARPLPNGANYILYLIKSGPRVFTPQIGRLTIKFGDAAGNGPKGLSVMSASGQSCVSWFPVSTATSYNVKRSVDGGAAETIATNLKTTTYVDSTASAGAHVTYAVSANDQTGESEDSDYQRRSSGPGVVMIDPLTDWSLAADHSAGLSIGDVLPGVHAMRRAAAGTQSVTYNMPGLADFAGNLYTTGQSFGDGSQVTAEVSVDSAQWTAIPLKFSDVDTVSPQWGVERLAPKTAIPAGSNYLRLSIVDRTTGGGPLDGLQIGQVRLIYGATSVTAKPRH